MTHTSLKTIPLRTQTKFYHGLQHSHGWTLFLNASNSTHMMLLSSSASHMPFRASSLSCDLHWDLCTWLILCKWDNHSHLLFANFSTQYLLPEGTLSCSTWQDHPLVFRVSQHCITNSLTSCLIDISWLKLTSPPGWKPCKVTVHVHFAQYCVSFFFFFFRHCENRHRAPPPTPVCVCVCVFKREKVSEICNNH